MITRNIHLLLAISFMLLITNCSNESNSSTTNEPLPNTPETVSKKWQSYLDNNEIEKVATLSTAATKEWLTENKEIFLSDKQIYNTKFIKMDCQTKGDRAACIYTIKEEGELIEDVFLLKKVGGQWLVDLEEEEEIPLLEEQIFKEMEKELKLD